MQVGILGVGLLSAGLDGWANGCEVLAGRRPFFPSSVPDPDPELLPANERRRSSDSVRWAVHVGQEAVEQSGLHPQALATVFASSGGEMTVLDKLCRALATSERVVSPTLFHQSVHNTAAGYWGIATSCQQSSTALSCYDDSCAAGFLEAVTYAAIEDCPVLFVAYDLPPPYPLSIARPISSGFATALVMKAGSAERAFARVAVKLIACNDRDVTKMPDEDLERLRANNPSGRLLPLLRSLARNERDTIHMNALDDQRLMVEVDFDTRHER